MSAGVPGSSGSQAEAGAYDGAGGDAAGGDSSSGGDGSAGAPALVCSAEVSCAAGALCSRLFDVASTHPVGGTFRFRLFDWLGFPDDFPSHPQFETTRSVDACGHVELTLQLSVGSQGHVLIVDHEDGSRLPTGVKIGGSIGPSLPPLFTLRDADAQRWSDALALDDVLDRAPVLLVYADNQGQPYAPDLWQPYAGVATQSYGVALPAYYFDDAKPLSRRTPTLAEGTGPNGSALVIDPVAASFSGAGPPEQNCTWSGGILVPAVGALLVGVRTPTCN